MLSAVNQQHKAIRRENRDLHVRIGIVRRHRAVALRVPIIGRGVEIVGNGVGERRAGLRIIRSILYRHARYADGAKADILTGTRVVLGSILRGLRRRSRQLNSVAFNARLRLHRNRGAGVGLGFSQCRERHGTEQHEQRHEQRYALPCNFPHRITLPVQDA